MPAIFARKPAASVIAFPAHLRAADGALTLAVKSHRLPAVLESALLREAALSGGGMKGLQRAIAARLRPEPIDLGAAQTIILFGPSGSGKSTVAAKIARAATAQGRRVEIAAAAKGVCGNTPADNRLIIADCAGFNPRNAKARSAFAALGELAHAQTIGVLSALSDAEEISEIAAAFNMRRVIMTGLDMARRAGSLAAAGLQGARLAHVTYGAKPGDALEILNSAAFAALLTTGARAD